MASDNSKNIAARLTEIYRGIEGFYIVNNAGGLGYFTADGQRLVKETFKELPDTPATGKLDAFLSTLREASGSFPPCEDREVGYLKPFADETVWHTATMVLHEHVRSELREALHRDMAKGLMTLDEGDRRFQDMTRERGLHRGLEALLGHISSFGIPVYFPVLYYRTSAGQDATNYPMRVLNLMSLFKDIMKFTDILATMRDQLTKRGVLNSAPRVEHRFTLLDED